ncbi:T-cell surface glycoprotein CD3 epsilon chain [Carassius gibelio]|uniref:T-cell surface glycoprotein CD3 epsilon chain n=1 Tax=Carassius langsdorfii TaxID=138676 RepID=A0A2Z6DT24_CARLG|nr:T-cell surface glycoprotein CD3 epsilon chain [Carassius gibelio]BBD74886.1 T-cell surface glycoprotein CD3 epsilon chain [Carassius langsdorfii]
MFLLSVMIVLLAAARAQDIEITDDGVIMICTGGDNRVVTWKNEAGKDVSGEGNKLNVRVPADSGTGIVEGQYSCNYTDGPNHIKRMFYINVKVCENCYELSGVMAWGVMIIDLLITGGVILIIYFCSARNSDSKPKKVSNSRPMNPPRPPNQDYAALDPKMRSGDGLYAGLNK